MDNKAQVSTEYLILVAVGTALAIMIITLMANILSIKDNMKQTIMLYRSKFLGT
ncbi:MAG: hypothetical protein V1911_04120 [Candidatus Micrarchaeota archaeon]